jgi:YT521-B-like domain
VNPPSNLVSTENQEANRAPVAEGTRQVAGSDPLDERAADEESPTVAKVEERFFVVKSLTVEDLEMSVRNEIWATQAHNEAALNKAYEASTSVSCIVDASLTVKRQPRTSI